MGINYQDSSVEELEIKLNQSLIDWEEHQNKAIENEEEKLLELHPTELTGDSEKTKRRKKKAIRSIKQRKI